MISRSQGASLNRTRLGSSVLFSPGPQLITALVFEVMCLVAILGIIDLSSKPIPRRNTPGGVTTSADVRLSVESIRRLERGVATELGVLEPNLHSTVFTESKMADEDLSGR